MSFYTRGGLSLEVPCYDERKKARRKERHIPQPQNPSLIIRPLNQVPAGTLGEILVAFETVRICMAWVMLLVFVSGPLPPRRYVALTIAQTPELPALKHPQRVQVSLWYILRPPKYPISMYHNDTWTLWDPEPTLNVAPCPEC